MPHSNLTARALGLLLCLAAAAAVPLLAAYKGHADDHDINALLTVYPALKGAPADSCASCHRSGVVQPPMAATARHENHCDYCHSVHLRGGRDARETLNAYGAAYLAAGRNAEAVRAIGNADADGDGAANADELAKGTDPGDKGSHPGLPLAPSRTYDVAALREAVSVVSQPVFLNTTKNRLGDAYNLYRGHRLWDILQSVGLSAAAQSVDLISLDGFEVTFTLDEVRKAWPQGAPVMGLGKDGLGACGWVTYNVPNLSGATPLPPAHIMLAFEENGQSLPPATMEPATGRIVGAGPLRTVTPQFEVSPPDLPQTADASCQSKVDPSYRFHEGYDHNGGRSSFAIVAVRVRPLPAGSRDVAWQTEAAARVAKGEVVFFGALATK